MIRPSKEISVFRVTGLKSFGRLSTHIFLNYFLGGKYNFMHFERHFVFQMHKIIFFPESLEKF